MQLVFVHIPKTAGFALHAALETTFGARNTLQINDEDKLQFLRTSPAERFARYHYISGHFDFADIRGKCRPDALFVSILRDPISRIISEYNYMFTSETHPYHTAIRRQSLGDYVYGSAEHFRGFICRQLAGTPDAAKALETVRTRYSLVGTKSNLPAFVERLAKLIGRPLNVEKINVTAGQGRLDLDTELCETLLDVTEEDRRLVETVAALPNGLFQNLPSHIAGKSEWPEMPGTGIYHPIGDGVYRFG